MANRRCIQTLTRCFQSFKALTPLSETLAPYSARVLKTIATTPPNYTSVNNFNVYPRAAVSTRNFSSKHSDSDEYDDFDDEDDDNDDEEDYESEEEGNANANANEAESVVLSAEEKEKEASEIGYKVIGPLKKSDRVFKQYEPVFAVVQIGSHQFKVSNGDGIFTEKLKHCDINDKLILNKVLMLGSAKQTIIGRPILPDVVVHAVVEEHALDAKVIIFKKKRRKNYRRTKGHRQELTKLRITDIQGIEKPKPPNKYKKRAVKVDTQGTEKPESLKKDEKTAEKVAAEA